MKDTDVAGGVADLRPLAQAREQKAWYWYDWANSAYVTTIATVLLAPYLIAIAEGGRGRQPDQRARALGRAGLAAVVPRHVLHDPLRADPAARWAR